MDAGTAQKYHFRVGEQVRILLTGPPQTFTITASPSSGRPTTWPAPPSPPSRCPPRSSCSTGSASTTPSTSWPRREPTRPRSSGPSPGRCPPGVEVVTGQTVADEQTSSINKALSFFSTALLVFAFISLFVGGVHHLQHLLDHRRPADTGAGPPADRRRQPAPGVPLGAGRGGHRRAGRLAGGPRSRGAGRASGCEALLQGFGDHPALGTARLREPAPWSSASVVGVGVTVVSAISPARRAVRIPPVAAISDQPSRGRRLAAAPVDPRSAAIAGSARSLLGVGLTAAGHPAGGCRGGGRLPRHAACWPRLVARPMSSAHRAAAGRACSGHRASWAGRTRCAARGAPPRPPPRSWSGWPWSRRSPSSARRCPSRPPQRRPGDQRRLHRHQRPAAGPATSARRVGRRGRADPRGDRRHRPSTAASSRSGSSLSRP